jgi:4-amino-4-deoxy-L-arabinose transferase-like glycosyltransferase
MLPLPSERRSSKKVYSRRVIPLVLACAVLVAGGLRFYRIAEPGFTEGADCMYTETAQALLLLAQWGWNHPGALGSAAETTAGLNAFFAQHAAIPYMPYSAKPLYDFTNALALALAGVSDAVLPALSALAGTLAVAAIFLLGKQLYGEGTGLWAAALMAISGGALVFSRYGQSHMVSLLFFILGFWLYLRSVSPGFSLRALGGCSLFFGFALSTHPNLLPYVGLFALYEGALLLGRALSWRAFLLRAGVGLGTLALLGALLNLPFQVIGHYFGPFFTAAEARMPRPFMTYFEQLPHHFGEVVTGTAPGLKERLYTYVVEAWAWEGSLVCGLAALGLARGLGSLRQARFPEIIVYSQLVFPLLFWIFTENQAVLRYAAGTLPIALLLAARELDGLALRLRAWTGWHSQVAALAVLAVVLGYNLPRSLVVLQARSAYKEVAIWLRRQGEGAIAVEHPRSFRFYGVQPAPMTTAGLNRVQYLGFYDRYTTEKERKVLSVLELQKPALEVADRRPGKLLEVEFMEKSLVLKLLQEIPGIGSHAREMRQTVLARNELRRIRVYEISSVRPAIAAVLRPYEQAELRGSPGHLWQ